MKYPIEDILMLLDETDPDFSILSELVRRYYYRGDWIDIASGKDRVVFIYQSYVIKIPKHSGGIGANDWEGSVSDGNTAKTKLAYYNNIPIVFMEKILDCIPYDELPDWSHSVDMFQVGYNKRNEIKAYDWGC